jgi:sigma-B regulation protein RsbU (phosphoserine phosphatase)
MNARRTGDGQPAPKRFDDLRGFVRSYTEGLSQRDLRRLFDRDAQQAYAVLTREHGLGPEPTDGFRRFLFRTRLIFLGLSYKLTPARRLLFAISLVLAFLGLCEMRFQFTTRTHRVSLEFSPLWFVASIAGLVFLLALELVDRVRVRDELEVARELQSELLPHRVPEVPGYGFAHSYRTANEVGGDYYDFTPLPDGRLALAVADASGHGMAAGLVMAIANATLETALDLDPEPQSVLQLLNRTLCRTGNRRTFLSLFYALLDPATGRLDSVCAGHPFPFLRRADGTVEELGCGGLPLGIREPIQPATSTTTLAPGDVLVFYTDGLVEATDPERKEAFGYERLQALVAEGGGPQDLHDRILAAFDAHTGGEPLLDDLTLVVMTRRPDLPPLPDFGTAHSV